MLLHPDHSISSPASLFSQSHPHITSLTLFHSLQRRRCPHSYQTVLLSEVPGGLSSFSPTETRQGSSARRKGSKGRQQSQRQPTLQLLGDPHEDQASHLLHRCRGPTFSPCRIFGWWVRLGEPHEPRLVDSVYHLVLSLTPPTPSIFSSPTHKTPQLCLLFPSSIYCWLWDSVSVSISCCTEPFRGQL